MNKPRTQKISVLGGLTDPMSLENSPEFQEAIDRDFGSALDGQGDGFSRRRWLQLMGASLALGSAAGCRFQEEKIAPFAFRPQNRLPGIPEKFATLTELGGVAEPLLATNSDGRPIKLDGNPNHPDSMGGSSTFTQARILEFYDPDRLRAPLHGITESTWEEFVNACHLPADLGNVAILAEPTSSPSLMGLQSEFSKQGGSWFTFSALSDDNTRAGSKQAFGTPYRAHYRFDQAKVIVTLDADPLKFDTGNIANSISFFKGRDSDNNQMNRLYSVESQYSTTGASADHRISVPSSKIAGFAAALAKAIDGDGSVDESLPYRERVLAAMASDLLANRGAGIIIAGERQPPEVHALVHRLNADLGNHGKTIQFAKLPDPDRPTTIDSIKEFASQLKSGQFKTVIILDGNPVYGAPQSLNLAELIAGIDNSIHISSYKNETSLACKWTSAMAHPLESWKDGFSHDGSILVGQPLINPLFGGKSDLETLAILMGRKSTSGQAIVRETLQLDDSQWQQSVHDGFVADSASGFESPTAGTAPVLAADDSWSKKWDHQSLEIVFTPSLSVYDGRFSNSSWLQELPDFFTKVTWDNVASVSPRTAEALGLKQFGMAANSAAMLMTITFNGVTLEIPVCIQPGQADGSIGLALGYGRTMAGRVGGDVANGIDPVGHDVSVLRSTDDWWFSTIGNDAAKPTGTLHRLAIVQEPWVIDEVGRGEIQARMFRDYNKKESDRSGLLREGSFKSYEEFLSRHPIESHESAQTSPTPTGRYATGNKGSLPVIHPVSFNIESPAQDDDTANQESPEPHHAATWPEAFHMHHDLFDLTPGTRENYKAENPEHTNVWGMAIDLNKCFGCNSCVTSCQSENNIPVVGKAEVWRGREMHWIRIDRYYGDNLYTEDAKDDDKQIIHQPVACHHCENAPCENVCPVAATVHSSEGLNDMVYNRCIGTRYCGNNCPYKVRRFNFFNYSDAVTLVKYPDSNKLPPGDLQLQNLMMNPEVTIRSRGVMEKCTYCVQRIQNTKILAKNEHRDIGANEIRTACQDACPTNAITFGDLNNHGSDVRAAHANPRAYTMLEELNNRPRTKYLARVRNLHPKLTSFDDRDSLGSHGGGEEHPAGDENHDHESAAPASKEKETAH